MIRDGRARMDASGAGDAGARADKRTAVLKATRRLISNNGFDNTSMDAIAERAGVSKATVYAYFVSKEALFKTALDEMIDEMPDPYESLFRLHGSLHARLTATAQALLNFSTGPAMKGLHRTLARSERFSLRRCDMYWDFCFGRYDKALQEFLALELARGVLAISDLACASSQFFGLIAGTPTVRALLTGEPFAPGKQSSRYVDDAVELFIRAYRSEPSPGA
jgi:TetR/AcrR family transcriptional regulator, mexJK operon transcriptional repressor